MKTNHKRTLWAVLGLILAISAAAEESTTTNTLIRSEGVYHAAGGTITVSNRTLKVVWDVGSDPVKPISLKPGWFIYAEAPCWLWVYNGSDLSVVPATRSGKSIYGPQWNWYHVIPPAVKAELPEAVLNKLGPKVGMRNDGRR